MDRLLQQDVDNVFGMDSIFFVIGEIEADKLVHMFLGQVIRVCLEEHNLQMKISLQYSRFSRVRIELLDVYEYYTSGPFLTFKEFFLNAWISNKG